MVVSSLTEDGALQRGLSEWWSEESEYLLQRIERWAALARGYNRLRPKCPDDQQPRSPETRRINCCGTFNYQSNSKLDTTCMETYMYDHSIYFKTIGDIRRSKDVKQEEDDEQVEWDVRTVQEPEIDRLLRNVWPIVDLSKLEDERNNNVPKPAAREGLGRMLTSSFRKTRRPKSRQVLGENNVSWPGVLLSYTPANMDPALSSLHTRTLNN